MAITKMTLDAIKARPSKRNRSKIEATTENEIRRHVIEGRRKPGRGVARQRYHITVVHSQAIGNVTERIRQYAGIPVATLRNWEQNRMAMEPATIALMRILAREPEAALRALGRGAA
jgi:putative transcriptional regulator